MWMEVAVVATIFAVGNILMGHWEAHTPKWRRLLKFVFIVALTLGISAGLGRGWAFGFLGLLGLAAVIIHSWWLPWRHGINGWTGEPKEKYYALRGWKYPPALLVVLLACLPFSKVFAQDETFAIWVRIDAIPVRRFISAPVERVWSALPGAFKDMGYSGGPSARKGERIYMTPSLSVQGRLYEGDLNSDYLSCGRTPAGEAAADAYAVQFALLARVSQRGDSTLVEVVIDGTARDRARSTNAIYCTGTGKIEDALLQRLEARVRGT